MKPIYLHLTGALALSFTLAACIPSAPEPAPVPTPTPTPAPAPPPPPTVVQPVYDNWMDAPQTPGDWTYRSESGSSLASFDPANVTLRCDRTNGQISLMRSVENGSSTAMTIRTETADRTLQAQQMRGPQIVATLQARDPLLDAMALSKGRFAIETPGETTLYLPAWAEVTRVIEDCR
ncbi:hypothetical protein [Qipengyuania atrilutea]|uniref:Lipoprotein n=1 Tax=Qipengyuania atrilutea TaxID=2744473 RepID=A0A850H0L9_9SPHN|nr:hypothetical protein [Actirhodobacter atriluteus]NVD44256.1 hypothetical protein [Actirhodobacter atriluteus]